MKKVIFDLCALIDLFEMHKNNKIEIKELNSKFEIYITAVNIFEILKHKSKDKRSELLKFCKALNIRDYFPVDYPSFLLIATYKDYINSKIKGEIGNPRLKFFIDNPSSISERDIISCRKILDKNEEFFKLSSKGAREEIIKVIPNFKDRDMDLNDFIDEIFTSDEILYSFFESIITKFKLPYIRKKNHIFLKEFEPWNLFFLSFFTGVYNLVFKRSKYSIKKNPGFIDISQSIYLIACDVFITNDNALYELLNSVINSKYCNTTVKIKRLPEFIYNKGDAH